MTILKPPRLRRGDVIGLIAPASAPSDSRKVELAVRYLEKLGYRVQVGEHVGARHGYFAGNDEQRIADLNAMLNDAKVKAIFAVRGGYGTPRLLPFVDYSAVRRQPKIIVGYSDLTALQLALFRKTGLITFSGPMAAVELWRNPDSYTEEHFWRMLTSPRKVGALPNPPGHPIVLRQPGRAEGRLLGGNLSLLVANLGTPFSPDYRGALLVLEDVGEQFHRLDRMFTQLRNAGVLAQISGLLLGHFTDCAPNKPKDPHLSLKQIFGEVLSWLEVPAVERFQYGHIPRKLTIPFGVCVRLDADRGKVEGLESAVV
ncbi:MAG TPA: LD-carboxypeptidase [Verrucomicrobiae bacterium]|nr:LD-carboxypeptidase [Verrucomicrobiae bacterium]